MNNQTVYNLYYSFVKRDFSVLRFNFRGVGRSQGYFDNGAGELSDAALDTVARFCQNLHGDLTIIIGKGANTSTYVDARTAQSTSCVARDIGARNRDGDGLGIRAAIAVIDCDRIDLRQRLTCGQIDETMKLKVAEIEEV